MDTDRCTCRPLPTERGGPPAHRIDCLTQTVDQPHAMINDHDEVFYPDDREDARVFATEEGARPVRPDRFPYVL